MIASIIVLLLLGGLVALAVIAYALVFRVESRSDRIVALLYHRLVPLSEFETYSPMERNFSIPEERFRDHLKLLRDRGYNQVSLDEVVDFIEGRRDGKPLPTKPVLITFDDGCESVYSRALPILREFQVPAAFFITTDPNASVFSHGADAQPRVSDEAIRELDRGGVTIGSHAVTHQPLQAMTAVEIEGELAESKRYIEEVLGKPVRYFAVPLNWYGAEVRDAAVRVGYRAVCTSDSGTIHGDTDLFHLRRLNVEGWFGPSDLLRQMEPSIIVQRRVINFFKRFPARLLGPKIWFPLRERLFASPLGPLFSIRNLRRLLMAGAVGLVLLAGWVAFRLAG